MMKKARRWMLLGVSLVSVALMTRPAEAGPVLLPILSAVAVWAAQAGLSLALTTVLVTAVSYGLQIGFTIALNYAINALFAPKIPKPEDRQGIARGGLQPRFTSFGRVKVGGVLNFAIASNGSLYRSIILGEGPIDAVEEHWIEDGILTLDSSGNVTAGLYNGRANVQHRTGTSTQVAYADLIAAAPAEWNASSRGDGIVHALVRFNPIDLEDFSSVFPKGENTPYRQVQRAAKVWDPRDPLQSRTDPTTWVWSDNAALVILFFCLHHAGYNWPFSFIEPALSRWIEAANICDELVALKAGGTTKRWKLSGSFDWNQRPGVTAQHMLLGCDGKLTHDSSGGIALSVGKWVEPTITVDESCIIDSVVTGGDSIVATSTILKTKYASPEHGYVMTDADVWRNEEAISRRGEIESPIEMVYVDSHSQARRVTKIIAERLAPRRTGTMTCNLNAAGVFGSRFIRIIDEENDIDETAEIVGDPEFVLSEDSVWTGITFSWASFSSEAYDWDAINEEGTSAVVPDPITKDSFLPTMTGLSASVQQQNVSGSQTTSYALILWTPGIASTRAEIEIKLVSDTEWQQLFVGTSSTVSQVKTGTLQDGAAYNVRGRFRTAQKTGPWTSTVSFTAVADPVAPPVVSAVTATGGVGTASVFWTSPNSPRYIKAKIYRGATSVFSASVFIADAFGAANSSQSFADGGLAAGTYYYWVKASNGSNVLSAEIGTGAVIVT